MKKKEENDLGSHSFEVNDAINYGVEKAILLQNLRFWLNKEMANSRGAHAKAKINKHTDGKDYVWTYNSAKAFGILFPYMNEKSISRWLIELESVGIIVSGCFNKSKYDKTKWYSMPKYCLPQNEQSEEIFEQQVSQDEQPIPDVITNINTDTFFSPSENEKTSLIPLEVSCHAVTSDTPQVPPPPPDVPFDNTPINLMPEPIFDSKEEIRKMIYGSPTKKPQKHISIIGMYIMAKRYRIESKEMLVSLISGRNLKAAKILTPYPTKQIWETMLYLQNNVTFDWGLESVYKYIDDVNLIK